MGVYRSMQCQLTALPYQADKCSVSANPVVNNTQQVRASNSVRWSECRTKIIYWTTPVIRAIIVWTVSSVKLLNNAVVGIGKAL